MKKDFEGGFFVPEEETRDCRSRLMEENKMKEQEMSQDAGVYLLI